jgi:hypothetical protein
MWQCRFNCASQTLTLATGEDSLGIIIKNRIWFWPAAVLTVVLYYGSVLVYLLVWPLILLYSSILCLIGWLVLPARGKDVVLVSDGADGLDPGTSEIAALVAHRAMFLDYQERKKWKRWSLPVQFFDHFGPMSIPERFMPGLLPAVILLRKFRWPKTFSFGTRSREPVEKMNLLRSELTKIRSERSELPRVQ